MSDTIILFTKHHGRYRIEFNYDPAAVQLLKDTVPGSSRRWIPAIKRWEVSIDWVGPLAGAFVNAGFDVIGLNQANITDWFAPFSTPMPTNEAGTCAYLLGLCKVCTTEPHRPGGVECEACFRARLIRQHHIKAILAEAGAAPYPEATPAVENARRAAYKSRAPLEVDRTAGTVDTRRPSRAHRYRGMTSEEVVVDLLLTAEHEETGTCPICGRRPAKGAGVHVGCRTRLLHALDDDRPFTKSRRSAFEDGACTVCRTRPHRGGATCARCAEVVDVCRSLRPIGESNIEAGDSVSVV